MRMNEMISPKAGIVEEFEKFLNICKEELDLKKFPKIEWVTDGSHHKKFHSFGSFHNENQTIYVELTNRHPIDVMRTLAHELVHYKQYTENRIEPNSGDTGSEIENEANATAAVIMRHFDDKYPAAFELQALSESEAWQKAAGKNPEGGLNKKGVASYRRSHPGSKLQTAVTTKPSKLKKGSKASKRRKSFCARMKGMKKSRTGAKTARDPDSRINKSLRKWNCESIEEMKELVMIAEAYLEEKAKQRLDAKCWTGYRKAGTKMKGGIRVNNCVKTEAANPAQQAAIAIAKKKKKEVSEDIATKLKDLYHHLRYTAGGDEEHKYKKSKYQGKGKPETDQDTYKGMSDFERGHTIRARSSDADHAREFIARRDNPRIDWSSEVDENFADGKGPGRPGDSARHGIPKHATMSELEKASLAIGRKGQLARWQMNMRNGKKK